MNNNTAQPTGTGSLVVKVSTARGAIPLEGARVNIRGTDGQSSDIIYSLMTNRDGLTELVTLPAPARGLSESPGNPTPYALYDLDIFKEGYIDLFFTDVAVFDSVTSIQPAIMIPRPANRFPDSFEPSDTTNPKDRESISNGGNGFGF
ncbi:MAG: hypothetical protein J6Q77_02970 [Clostridia bacterium]|nr:hypothetical protein [Clostridia bacterium]